MTEPIQKVSYTGVTATNMVRDVGVAVHNALIDEGRDVHRACYIVPGQIAWDECDCGQLAQTITDVAPSDAPPTPVTDQRHTACGPGIAVIRVTLSLTRCVPTVNDVGHPPSCDALDDAAVDMERDRYTVRSTVTCYLRQLRAQYQVLEYGVNTATSVGPNGMCAGIQLPYWFAIHDFCC